jgi:hypothetical protein
MLLRITKTDGVHHITKDRGEKREWTHHRCGYGRRKGKNDPRPVKNEMDETVKYSQQTLQVSVGYLLDSMSKISRCETSGSHGSDYKDNCVMGCHAVKSGS